MNWKFVWADVQIGAYQTNRHKASDQHYGHAAKAGASLTWERIACGRCTAAKLMSRLLTVLISSAYEVERIERRKLVMKLLF